MNWLGGTRARIQKQQQNETLLRRQSQSQRPTGLAPHPAISITPPPPPPTTTLPNNISTTAARRLGLPYTNYDVASDPRYELVQKQSDNVRFRTVPLLQSVKSIFPNGDVLALQLSHQMGIEKIKEKRVTTTSTATPSTSTNALDQDDDGITGGRRLYRYGAVTSTSTSSMKHDGDDTTSGRHRNGQGDRHSGRDELTPRHRHGQGDRQSGRDELTPRGVDLDVEEDEEDPFAPIYRYRPISSTRRNDSPSTSAADSEEMEEGEVEVRDEDDDETSENQDVDVDMNDDDQISVATSKQSESSRVRVDTAISASEYFKQDQNPDQDMMPSTPDKDMVPSSPEMDQGITSTISERDQGITCTISERDQGITSPTPTSDLRQDCVENFVPPLPPTKPSTAPSPTARRPVTRSQTQRKDLHSA